MAAVLGIDAAWTAGEPSGVALLRADGNGWGCVAVAPSYHQFLDLADHAPVDWSVPPSAGLPHIPDLLVASKRLLGGEQVGVIAVDMPLSLELITGRRAAENQVSTTFGRFGCSAHTPNAHRPGPISNRIRRQCRAAGYPLATVATAPGTVPAVIEAYPHPALLALTRETYRLRYKLSRSGRYYPGVRADERRRRIAATWIEIDNALAAVIGETGLPLPLSSAVGSSSTARLKRFEDALDALVCAWVATEYLRQRCVPYGDDTAAIWTPECQVIGVVPTVDAAT